MVSSRWVLGLGGGAMRGGQNVPIGTFCWPPVLLARACTLVGVVVCTPSRPGGEGLLGHGQGLLLAGCLGSAWASCTWSSCRCTTHLFHLDRGFEPLPVLLPPAPHALVAPTASTWPAACDNACVVAAARSPIPFAPCLAPTHTHARSFSMHTSTGPAATRHDTMAKPESIRLIYFNFGTA